MTKTGRLICHATVMSFTALLAAAPAKAEDPPTLQWGRQLGPVASPDGKIAVSTTDGIIFIGGSTRGDVGGPAFGQSDAWLAQFDLAGNRQWVRQLGTSMIEDGRGIAADGAGGVLLTGYTDGALAAPKPGDSDIFLAKYDDAGDLLWTRLHGTQTADRANGVAVDGNGNAYLAGSTLGDLGAPRIGSSDAVLVKYDATGVHIWTRQFGTANGDNAVGVAVDRLGNAVTTGYSNLSALTTDSFVAKHDAAGNQLWFRQFGTAGVADQSQDIAVDRQNNVFVTGFTGGNLGGPLAGGSDAFLLKYDAGGNVLWSRQFGSDGDELAEDVSVDGQGNAYVTGRTSGNLGGDNAGATDVFLTKYSPTGVLVWTQQFGTTAFDSGTGVSILPTGDIVLTGPTQGGLFGSSPGANTDAWIAVFSQVPEPSGLGLISIACLFLKRLRNSVI